MHTILKYCGNILLFIILILSTQIPLLLLNILFKNENPHIILGWILVIASYLLIIFGVNHLIKKKTHQAAFKALRLSDFRFSLMMFVVIILFKGLFLQVLAQLPTKQTFTNDKALLSLVNHHNLLLMAITIVILGPIAEELIFRGYFFNTFFKNNPWAQILISGLIFGLLHSPTNLIIAVIYIVMGWILGFTYYKRQNLSASLTTHILNNAPFIFALFK